MLFHLPKAFYEDTKRRYKRMEYYNNPKVFDYDYNNDFIFNNELCSKNTKYYKILCDFFSYIVALLPLFILLNIHWIFIILLNWFIIGPAHMFIAGYLTPNKAIFSIRFLKPISIIFMVLGIIFFLIGIYTI